MEGGFKNDWIQSLKYYHEEATSHHLLALLSSKLTLFPSKLGGENDHQLLQA